MIHVSHLSCASLELSHLFLGQLFSLLTQGATLELKHNASDICRECGVTVSSTRITTLSDVFDGLRAILKNRSDRAHQVVRNVGQSQLLFGAFAIRSALTLFSHRFNVSPPVSVT